MVVSVRRGSVLVFARLRGKTRGGRFALAPMDTLVIHMLQSSWPSLQSLSTRPELTRSGPCPQKPEARDMYCRSPPGTRKRVK